MNKITFSLTKTIRFQCNNIAKGVVAIFCIVLMSHLSYGEDENTSYTLSEEIELSTPDMSCDYNLREDTRRLYFYFEYPKIILIKNSNPFVFFIDENSEQLIITQIENHRSRILKRIDKFSDNQYNGKWPVIFTSGNEIYLAVLKNEPSPSDLILDIQFYILSETSYDLKSGLQITVSKISPELSHSIISDIFLFEKTANKYLLIGSSYKSLTALGGPLRFKKPFSITLAAQGAMQFNCIDKDGRFDAHPISYSAVDSGKVDCIWIRKKGRFETLFYSNKRGDLDWSDPLEIQKNKSEKGIPYNWLISIASNDEKASFIWQDPMNRLFYAEAKVGDQYSLSFKEELFKEKKIMDDHIKSVWPKKMIIDNQGNIHALLHVFYKQKYKASGELILVSKIKGKWTPHVSISNGAYLTFPNMAIDEMGIIHLTYLKSVDGKYRCFYRRLIPSSDN